MDREEREEECGGGESSQRREGGRGERITGPSGGNAEENFKGWVGNMDFWLTALL